MEAVQRRARGPGGGYEARGEKGRLYGSMGQHRCTTSTTNHRLLRTFIQKARVPGIWSATKRA